MRTIFEVGAVSLVEINGDRGGDLWITFGFLGDGEPFGRPFFEKRGIRALCFVSQNDWFQNSGMLPVVARASQVTREFPGNIVLYGSSMGAFGALAFSRDLNATTVIAGSPQISIDQNIVGSFDKRFASHAAAVEFVRPDCRSGISKDATISIIYDDLHSIDRKHANLLGEFPNVKLYPFSLAGHASLHTLNHAGLLQDLLPGFAAGREPADKAYHSVRTRYKEAVRKTWDYYFAIAERYFDAGRYRESVRWFDEALSRGRENVIISRTMTALSQLRQEEIDGVGAHIRISNRFINNDRQDLAASVLEEAGKRYPSSAPLDQAIASLNRVLGQKYLESSLNGYMRAIAAEPNISDWYVDAADVAMRIDRREVAQNLILGGLERFPENSKLRDLKLSLS